MLLWMGHWQFSESGSSQSLRPAKFRFRQIACPDSVPGRGSQPYPHELGENRLSCHPTSNIQPNTTGSRIADSENYRSDCPVDTPSPPSIVTNRSQCDCLLEIGHQLFSIRAPKRAPSLNIRTSSRLYCRRISQKLCAHFE